MHIGAWIKNISFKTTRYEPLFGERCRGLLHHMLRWAFYLIFWCTKKRRNVEVDIYSRTKTMHKPRLCSYLEAVIPAKAGILFLPYRSRGIRWCPWIRAFAGISISLSSRWIEMLTGLGTLPTQYSSILNRGFKLFWFLLLQSVVTLVA